MKTGRNEPCPCGSGKKYKHCCLRREMVPPTPAALAAQRLSRELQDFPSPMLDFVVAAYGPGAIDEAWSAFMLWDHEAMDMGIEPDSEHMDLFLPWLFHQWFPDPEDTEVLDESLHGVPPTQALLQRKRRRHSRLLRSYLESCLRRPFSFYELESVAPGHGITLRDVLTGERHDLLDASATQSLVPHTLLFGQLGSTDEVTLIEAAARIVFPPDAKVAVIALRKAMREQSGAGADEGVYVAPEQLRQWDIELRELYLDFAEQLLYPPEPTVLTPEGDPLEFHELVYEVDSAQQAFDALAAHAAHDDAGEAPEAHIEHDADGVIHKASLDILNPGHRADPDLPPLLGHAVIDGPRLTIQALSSERATCLREQLIPEAFGQAMTPRNHDVQPVGEVPTQPMPPPEPGLPSDNATVQTALVETMQAHYDQWIDSRIPMLGERTPRATVADADGREQVAAMLNAAEQAESDIQPEARKAIFDAIRSELGIEQ